MYDTNGRCFQIVLFVGSGNLVISPTSVKMLGGEKIFIAGPCFESSNIIVCEFSGGKLINRSYISSTLASCTVPILSVTGRLTVRMSVDNGRSFDYQGNITSGKLTF